VGGSDSQESEATFISAVFPRDLCDSLARSARAHDRSVSGELREAVRAYIGAKDPRNSDPPPRAGLPDEPRGSAGVSPAGARGENEAA
jgi:hypothetical protein